MEYLDIVIAIAIIMYIKAIILCIWIYSKYDHLTEWLVNHAPMTWETYKRLSHIKSECNQDCSQGRKCSCENK